MQRDTNKTQLTEQSNVGDGHKAQPNLKTWCQPQLLEMNLADTLNGLGPSPGESIYEDNPFFVDETSGP